MLMAVFGDAIFCGALFFETLAVLSFIQSAYPLELREVFRPLLSFYHEQTSPLAAFGANFFSGMPVWFADASIIGAVFFFLFCIRQARRAMAPYDDDSAPLAATSQVTYLEAAIDQLLPPVVCALAAAALAPTLLPFLTPPIALWLLLKRLLRKPAWFEVSPSYYVNIVLLAAITAAILSLPR